MSAPATPPSPAAVPDLLLLADEPEALFDGQRPDFYIASQERQTMISVHFFSDGRRKRLLLPYSRIGVAFFTDPDTIIIPIGAHELICKFTPPSPEARQLAAEFDDRERRRIRAGQGAPGGGSAPAENQGLPDVDAWELAVEPSAASAIGNAPAILSEVDGGEEEEVPNPLIAAALATPEAQPASVLAESASDAPPSAHEPEPALLVPEFPGQNVRKFMDLLQNWMIRGLFSVPDSGMTVRVMKKAAAPDQPDVEI